MTTINRSPANRHALDQLDDRNKRAVAQSLDIPGYYLMRPTGLSLYYLHRDDDQMLPLAISPNLAFIWATRGYLRILDRDKLERDPNWRTA